MTTTKDFRKIELSRETIERKDHDFGLRNGKGFAIGYRVVIQRVLYRSWTEADHRAWRCLPTEADVWYETHSYDTRSTLAGALYGALVPVLRATSIAELHALVRKRLEQSRKRLVKRHGEASKPKAGGVGPKALGALFTPPSARKPYRWTP
jgi:hypothetical protein